MPLEQTEQLYSGFAGHPLTNPLSKQYYPSHASFEPKPYAQAVGDFRKQFIAAAIEDLENRSKVVNYKNLATLLYESRHLERQITEIGLKPFLMHYYTERGSRKELSPEALATYTSWKNSLDSRVADEGDIFEHPNLNPDIRVSAIAAKIIEEARNKGNYNLREAVERFRALYVASVVKRVSEDKYTRTLAEPKAKAARYLKVSPKTIDRMLEKAIEFGYVKIAKVKDPDTNYTYELMSLQDSAKQKDIRQDSGIEQRV